MMDFHNEQSAVFWAEDICLLRKALESACQALAFAFEAAEIDAATRTQLARSILDLAASGERRPSHLSAFALKQQRAWEAAYVRPRQSADRRDRSPAPVWAMSASKHPVLHAG